MFDNPSDKKYLIPMAVLKPLTKGPWKYDDFSSTQFAWSLDIHHEGDRRSGQTSYYVMHDDLNSDMMTTAELKAIIKAGAINPAFYNADNGYGLNQHWLHSMCQFYAECTKAWVEHETRTTAILGTPAGRIWQK